MELLFEVNGPFVFALRLSHSLFLLLHTLPVPQGISWHLCPRKGGDGEKVFLHLPGCLALCRASWWHRCHPHVPFPAPPFLGAGLMLLPRMTTPSKYQGREGGISEEGVQRPDHTPPVLTQLSAPPTSLRLAFSSSVSQSRIRFGGKSQHPRLLCCFSICTDDHLSFQIGKKH